MRPLKARRIVIAVCEGVSLLDLAGPLEAFRLASGFGGSRESRVTVAPDRHFYAAVSWAAFNALSCPSSAHLEKKI
jgi:transcriptional regulator GlxA family with amidase domain